MIRLALALAAMVFLAGCAGPHAPTSQAPAGSAAAPEAPAASPAAAIPSARPAAGKVHKLPSGLIYEDIVIGNGRMADPGLQVSVHYTGTLTDGFKFDSSYDRGEPYKFVLGAGSVIAGWDEGIKGMRLGGKRKLTVPPDMGYGAPGYPAARIPPNATLVFEVELAGVR